MRLQALVSNNYDYLNKVAKRIASRKDYDLASDLFNHAYEEIYRNNLEFPCDDEGFIKWFSRYMKNLFVFSKSSFNKTYFPKFIQTGIPEESEFLACSEAQSNIEISVEETNEVTRELIEISSSLGKGNTLKYIEVIDFKRTLPEHEKLLFELYFEKGLSTRGIAKMYSEGNNHHMNYQAVNAMVNIIKDKINQQTWSKQ